MPSFSSSSFISFNIFMEKKKRRNSSTVLDDLATVKAAAWAWYQRGSGSEGKSIHEFDLTRTHHHHHNQSFRPSRYKLEAMKKIKEEESPPPPQPPPPPPSSQMSSLVDTIDNSLLDAYEVERISEQLDYLLDSNSNRFFDTNIILDRQSSSNSTISSSSDICYSTNSRCRSSSSNSNIVTKKNKTKKFLKGLWMSHAVVCGTREDVDPRAFDRRPSVLMPRRHVPVVRMAVLRPRAAHA